MAKTDCNGCVRANITFDEESLSALGLEESNIESLYCPYCGTELKDEGDDGAFTDA